MKIAFIGTKGMNIDGQAFGGFETVITELGPRLVRNGYKVTVYCRKKLYPVGNVSQEIKGVKLKFINSIETKNLGTMTQSFLSVLDAIKNKTQVVFLFNIGLGIYVPILKLFKIKVITNLDGIEWERNKWSKIAKLFFKFGAQLNSRYSDVLISDAEAIKNIYKEKYNRLSIVISYGAEIRTDLDTIYINQLGLKVGDYNLLVTRFVPENNPLFIVRSYLLTKTSKPLVVLGGNYYKSSYEKEIKTILDPRIIFLGHIANRKLLLEFYKFSYLYIHAHSVGGTNPTMLEALANSCCILALDTVFNREMLDNGEYGLFFKLNETDFVQRIDSLENTPEKVKSFKEKSSRRINDYYNWEKVTQSYIQLLTNLEKFSK